MTRPEGRIRTERLVSVALVVLVLVLTALFFILRRTELSPQFVASPLPLYFLAMLNAVLILALLFMLFRNLIRLAVEWRRGVLGSRFRAKMVFTFFAMTLLPSVVLFSAALYLIQRSVDQWFSTPVDEMTRNAEELVEKYHDSVKQRARQFAQDLAATVRRGKLLEEENQRFLLSRMESALSDHHLDLISVFKGDQEPALAVNPLIPLDDLGGLSESLMQRALQGEAFDWIDRLGKGLLVRSGVPIRSTFSSEVVGVAVTGIYIPEDLTTRVSRLVSASANYRQLKARRVLVKRVYEFTFGLVALLIVFSGTWVGLFLARGFAAPVQALAEGTKEIAAGNLEHRIEVEARDEMRILVDSFNNMTQELRHGREEIERSNLELQRSNLELQERRRYTEALMENITTGVISLDHQGNITTMNQIAYRILRLEASSGYVGRSYRELLSREGFEPLAEFVERARTSRLAQASHEFHFASGGRNYSIAVTLTSLDRPRRSRDLLMVLEDLTHLIRAQKIAAWREVARRMAHEIKNPLTPIQLSAQRMAKKLREGSPDLARVVEEGTTAIINEVNTLKTLMNEFERYARMPEVQPVPTDVHQVIEAAISLQESAHAEVTFVRSFDSSVPAMPLDREQLKRVFLNLLENALEAMDRQGEITLSTEYLAHQGVVRIEVVDSGPGIPPGDRDKLFLPYFSTKRRGTGLGLAIVNRIISDHHGGIRVEENEPHGARFVIDLPADAA
ncbi:MAG: HAMP domain-containing protein [Acidobacteria bacterium]|nr:MAG: HAMP domain-containing protein [Acidobacteriota bacterium]